MTRNAAVFTLIASGRPIQDVRNLIEAVAPEIVDELLTEFELKTREELAQKLHVFAR